MVEAVPDQKLVGSVEPDELRRMVQLGGNVLVQQRADLDRCRVPSGEQLDECAQGPAGIDDILN